jgi:hypothetical protein
MGVGVQVPLRAPTESITYSVKIHGKRKPKKWLMAVEFSLSSFGDTA